MGYQIETGWFCSSWFASYEVTGSKGDTYIVTLGGGEAPAHCEKQDGAPCPAYKFSGQDMYCKHVKYIHTHACLKNIQWHDGNPNPIAPLEVYGSPLLGKDDLCPNCGAEKVAVRIAV